MDLFIPHWAVEQDCALDVTVTHPLRPTIVDGAVVTAGHAVVEAHRRKMTSTAEDCRREGIVFLPLAVESLGGWHSVAVEQVTKLAAALARHTGEDEQEKTRHLWQKLAVLLQRGNAALILNRMPATYTTP